VYVLAALWGIADAIWQTQINALYGSVFASNEEAAFSNYKLWESSGFLFSFLSQDSNRRTVTAMFGPDQLGLNRNTVKSFVPKILNTHRHRNFS
jgi:hypothetical protein